MQASPQMLFLQANAFFYEGAAAQKAYWQTYASAPDKMPFLLMHVCDGHQDLAEATHGFLNLVYWMACVYHTYCGGFCDATEREDLVIQAQQAQMYLHGFIDGLLNEAYTNVELEAYLHAHFDHTLFEAVYAAMGYEAIQIDIDAAINVWDFATHPDVQQYL